MRKAIFLAIFSGIVGLTGFGVYSGFINIGQSDNFTNFVGSVEISRQASAPNKVVMWGQTASSSELGLISANKKINQQAKKPKKSAKKTKIENSGNKQAIQIPTSTIIFSQVPLSQTSSMVQSIVASSAPISSADSVSTSTSLSSSSAPETPIAPLITPQIFNFGHIVISEIMAGGDIVNNEFIELYNPTDAIIDLSKWILKKKVNSSGNEYNLVSASGFNGVINPKSFFLIAHKDYVGNVAPDLRYSNNSNPLAFDNNSVILYDSNNNIVDSISYPEIPKNKSYERSLSSASQFSLQSNPNPQNSSN